MQFNLQFKGDYKKAPYISVAYKTDDDAVHNIQSYKPELLASFIKGKCWCFLLIYKNIFTSKNFRVSAQGVESLWGDYRFIPADWGS